MVSSVGSFALWLEIRETLDSIFSVMGASCDNDRGNQHQGNHSADDQRSVHRIT